MEEDEGAIEQLQSALGHQFDAATLLVDALTHRSFANERPHLARGDNERLEFLGDAVLSAIVSTMLWEQYATAPEGELTRRRADLVCEPTLAALARNLKLGAALRLGRGEAKSGGRDKPRLLASALEACIGAVYLDGGFPAADGLVRRLFSPLIESDFPGAHDFKSRVQELTQAAGHGTPTYQVRSTEGPDHERTFSVAIFVAGDELAVGRGRSKLEAEQQAARQAHEKLTNEEW